MSGHVTDAFEDDVDHADPAFPTAVSPLGHFRRDFHGSDMNGLRKASCDVPVPSPAEFGGVDGVSNGRTTRGQTHQAVTGFHGHDHSAHVEVNGLFAHEDLSLVHEPLNVRWGFNLPVAMLERMECERRDSNPGSSVGNAR